MIVINYFQIFFKFIIYINFIFFKIKLLNICLKNKQIMIKIYLIF